jgi:hypothetical protein
LNEDEFLVQDDSAISRPVALPGAAQRRRNTAHGALAGVSAGGTDDCGASLLFGWSRRADSSYSPWLYWLLTVYLVHAVVVMLLVRFRPQSTAAFRLVVHAADIVWPVLISMFATAQQEGQFFLFFVFVMAAAAYRWGLWETVGTAAAAVALTGDRSLRGASWTGAGGGSMAAEGCIWRAGRERAGTGSATAFMSSVYLRRARITARLHVGKPEKSAG